MRRQKRLTKRERKALNGGTSAAHHAHIHCVACGRHIEHDEFSASPPLALFVRCQHGSRFAACVGCQARAQALLDEHDRTGQPVRQAAAWH